ncbi:hypothetical protein E05_15970 [Plautia stali symbiont]|nr:hypothetical protein E05_15970 [Plautia stali symbiont]
MTRSARNSISRRNNSWIGIHRIPVYYRVSVRLVKPWVGGFSGKDPQDMLALKYYYIKKH